MWRNGEKKANWWWWWWLWGMTFKGWQNVGRIKKRWEDEWWKTRRRGKSLKGTWMNRDEINKDGWTEIEQWRRNMWGKKEKERGSEMAPPVMSTPLLASLESSHYVSCFGLLHKSGGGKQRCYKHTRLHTYWSHVVLCFFHNPSPSNTTIRCQHASSSKVSVRWSKSFRTPHTFLMLDWGNCNHPYLTFMLRVVSCVEVRKEPFSFFTQQFLSLFMQQQPSATLAETVWKCAP